MDSLFTWCAEHATLCTIAGVVLAYILGASMNKFKMLGFTISQWVRKIFGQKLEKKLEDAIDAISEGMKSDNLKGNHDEKIH